jgi:hypothetical protein
MKTKDITSEFSNSETNYKHSNIPLVLVIPVSYDTLINSVFSKEKHLEDILTENPSLIYSANNSYTEQEGYNKDKDSYTSPQEDKYDKVDKTDEDKNIQIYNNIDANGLEFTTTISNLYVLPTILDMNNLEKIKSIKTDISCWWCCHQFNTYPVCAPVHYDSKKDIFKVKGCFCSFNCSKSYMYSSDNKIKEHSLISFLHKKITGKHTTIKNAPPKEILKKFGGTVGIEEYRESFNNVITYKQIVYPMIYVTSQLEKRKNNYNDKKLADNNIEIYKKNRSKHVELSNSKINKSLLRDTLVKNNKKNNNTNNLSKMFKKNSSI